MFATFQVGEAFIGFVLVISSPLLSTATQSVDDGQATATSLWLPSMSSGLADHVGEALVGSVVVISRPLPSTATQTNPAGSQPTASSVCPLSARWTFQVGVAAVGSVLVITSPGPPTAAHREVDGHESPSSALKPSSVSDVQLEEPLVGAVPEVMRSPFSSTATQKVVAQPIPI
jgi:hypothetical protein